MIQIERMKTLFLFALNGSNQYLALLVLLMPVSFIFFLVYQDWKPKHDRRCAKNAAERLHIAASMAMGHIETNCLVELKTLLRYCRVYKVPLTEFGFSTPDGLVDTARMITFKEKGGLGSLAWDNIQAELAPYYLRHI